MYQHHGLKGSSRIVFEDLCRLLARGEQPSVTRLADESGYCRETVRVALCELRDQGLVEIRQANGRGSRAEYRITEGDMIDIRGMLCALVNAVTMSKEQRARRMVSAIVSTQVYGSGNVLADLAGQIGGPFEAEVADFIDAHGILERHRVWDLVDANELQAELERRIDEAHQILENRLEVARGELDPAL
jgi:DNA-binding transcriptional regulator YhcF (GntR family)